MGGSGSGEVYLVTAHVGFEFDSVLTSYEVGVLVVVVQEVVDLRLMEISRGAQRSSSYRTSASAGNATLVKAQVVNVVLSPLLLKFRHTLSSVTSRGFLFGWCVSRFVSQINTVLLGKLLFRSLFIF